LPNLINFSFVTFGLTLLAASRSCCNRAVRKESVEFQNAFGHVASGHCRARFRSGSEKTWPRPLWSNGNEDKITLLNYSGFQSDAIDSPPSRPRLSRASASFLRAFGEKDVDDRTSNPWLALLAPLGLALLDARAIWT